MSGKRKLTADREVKLLRVCIHITELDRKKEELMEKIK
jgi:hypothetical protein